MRDSFNNFILTLFAHSEKKDLSIQILQHQFEMELSRPLDIVNLGLSKFRGLVFLYLDPLMKNVLKTLFLMIRRSDATKCLCCLSTNGELLHLHGRLSGFVKDESKSRSLANLLKCKNLVDIGGVSF